MEAIATNGTFGRYVGFVGSVEGAGPRVFPRAVDACSETPMDAETFGAITDKESQSDESDDVKIDAVEILGDWHLRTMMNISGIIMEVEHAWPLG